jgi:carbon monoxide dehydrogenase subunit G
MALEFQQSFVVKAPLDKVWAFLTDPRRAASALPGATVTEQMDDKTFAGTITVKVGPVSTQYRGQARFERLDPKERVVEMTASGQDVKGRGGADMKMTSRLVEKAPGETEVSVVSAVNITGILAQLGRGMIQDVSDQMFQRFTAAVRADLETGEAGASPAPTTSTTAAATGAATGSTGSPGTAAAATAGTIRTSGTGAPPGPPAGANAPLDAVSFGTELAGRVLGRWARTPAFWVGVAALVAVLYWLLL